MGSLTEQSVMGVIRAARPSFRNAHDKVAFAVHASFLASGFLLHATGPPAFSDDVLSSTFTEEVGIEQWNEFDDSYAFVYSNPDKGSKKILVKCLAMNDKLLLDALRGGDSEAVHLGINVRDYVAEDGGNNNYTTMFKNIGKLVRDVDKEILVKFGGSSSTASSSAEKPSSESRVAERDDSKSDQPSPRVSEPDDHFGFNPPNPGFIVPPIPGSGGDDLFPGAGAGIYPRGNFGGPGSMLIGPNDPRWFGGSGHPHLPGGLQPGVPPGARFDPYGPPGVPGFEPNRFIRHPRRPGGGTHPDLEHFGDGSDII